MNSYVALKTLYALSSTENVSSAVRENSGVEQLIGRMDCECSEVAVLAAKVLNNLSSSSVILGAI